MVAADCKDFYKTFSWRIRCLPHLVLVLISFAMILQMAAKNLDVEVMTAFLETHGIDMDDCYDLTPIAQSVSIYRNDEEAIIYKSNSTVPIGNKGKRMLKDIALTAQPILIQNSWMNQ